MKEGRPKVHLVTMGCAKNLVDSEKLMAQLKLGDMEITGSADEADIAIINTCGFIEAAKKESIDAIMEQVRQKSTGKLKKVYAMGCLTERYREELLAEIPEVDRFFGSNRIDEVLRELGLDLKHELLGERVLSTPSHYAYLKVSEGCDHPCSFCAIPLMRGAHLSRPVAEILEETRLLAEKGVREISIIGQDTTYYGLDLYGKRRLADVLERVASVPGIEWVRLMYAYPASFPLEVLDVLANHPHICKYIDMPVQHCTDRILKSMRRGISRRALDGLLDTMRGRVPGIALRTTLIVGYPTETLDDFEQLLSFVDDQKFHRLGVFSYSLEDGTHAFGLGDTVPVDEKERRNNLVMELQREISQKRNESFIGSNLRVLVDRVDGGQYFGRTEMDAPEIDNEVIIQTDTPLRLGDFLDVEVTDALEYDLIGRATPSAQP